MARRKTIVRRMFGDTPLGRNVPRRQWGMSKAAQRTGTYRSKPAGRVRGGGKRKR